MSAPASGSVPELSHPFALAELAENPDISIEINADAEQRRALAARYGYLALDSLKAQLQIRRDINGDIVVEGHLQADVTQECVVTLEPVADSVSAPFEQRYSTVLRELEEDLVIGPDDSEPPEHISGDSIDLGELVSQFLSLSVNPYPRAPGADLDGSHSGGDAGDDGPFAALAQLRQEEGDQS